MNYPKGKEQSAVMALLYIAQKQNDNWIPLVAMKYIAKFIRIPYIQVYEVATFYTMYNLSPVGKYHLQVCTTTPCMIRGAYKLIEVCRNKISEKEKLSKFTNYKKFEFKQNKFQIAANYISIFSFLGCLLYLIYHFIIFIYGLRKKY